jgi:E3 ubiquitin-protein ligase MARCH6
VLRIVLLLVLAWMTLLICNAGMIVIPISLGRLVFEAIPRLPITHGIKCNGTLLVILILFVYEIDLVTYFLTSYGNFSP